MAPLVILAARTCSLERLSQAQFLANLIVTPISFASLRLVLKLTFRDVVRANARPAVAAAAMFVVVLLVSHLLDFPNPPGRLIPLIAIGGLAFIGGLLGAWYLSGRPAGLEQALVAGILRSLHKSGVES